MAGTRLFGRNGRRSCVCCLPRRDVLAGFAAVAASASVPAAPAIAQPKGGRIDVHRHFVPPGYLVDKRRTYLNDRSTIPAQLEEMDKSGTALAVISISVPDLDLRDNEAARKFSRMANEFSAKLCASYPGR